MLRLSALFGADPLLNGTGVKPWWVEGAGVVEVLALRCRVPWLCLLDLLPPSIRLYVVRGRRGTATKRIAPSLHLLLTLWHLRWLLAGFIARHGASGRFRTTSRLGRSFSPLGGTDTFGGMTMPWRFDASATDRAGRAVQRRFGGL